jgi:hypothetical protein
MRFAERLVLGRIGVFDLIKRQIIYTTMVTAAVIPRDAGAGRRWDARGRYADGSESAVARFELPT